MLEVLCKLLQDLLLVWIDGLALVQSQSDKKVEYLRLDRNSIAFAEVPGHKIENVKALPLNLFLGKKTLGECLTLGL